ncbi:calcineurin-like phosphoesterase [Aureococcus anophagefferens]|nr:calcineurin-like phosphoesterase [Aureococcus anophagefferens]
MHGRVVLALVACAAGSFEHLHILPDNDALTELWFIGDLHGDVGCARQWVARSGLVAFDAAGPRWTGRAGSALVFLGDYVDKGVHSSDVLARQRRRRGLPDRAAAIMGNHDLFLYLDATLDGSDPRRPMRMSVQAYPYSFFHPEEYAASPFTAKRDDDGEVLDALLESLLFVYETRATRTVLVPTPSAPARRRRQPLRRRAAL